jgi:hypothetical protein
LFPSSSIGSGDKESQKTRRRNPFIPTSSAQPFNHYLPPLPPSSFSLAILLSDICSSARRNGRVSRAGRRHVGSNTITSESLYRGQPKKLIQTGRSLGERFSAQGLISSWAFDKEESGHIEHGKVQSLSEHWGSGHRRRKRHCAPSVRRHTGAGLPLSTGSQDPPPAKWYTISCSL